MRKWYADHPGYAAEQGRKHRARAREYENTKYHYDPDFNKRKRARNAVNIRLRRGTMERGACEVCGSAESQAHHDNYDKPLEVRWLCELHHRALHGEHTAVLVASSGGRF